MSKFEPFLQWIDAQQPQMVRWVSEWAAIPSGTDDLPGLARMIDALESAASPLGAHTTRIDLPPEQRINEQGLAESRPLGQALRLRKRPQTPLQIFLAIHMDTVYGLASSFRQVERVGDNLLHGPGVTDAKGGIAILFTALAALERSPWADAVGWEVLINPDEEIGSPGSSPLFIEAASRHHLGLLFEPAMADGALVDRRSGSGNFTLVVRGKAAHAGRDFAAGRNAVAALAESVVKLHALNGQLPGVTVNIGQFHGGGAVNVVPDLAIARINIRTRQPDDEALVTQHLRQCVAATNAHDGFSADLHGQFTAPPKLLDPASAQLLEHILATGRELGLTLAHRPSGGVCDGNRLAAAGLPTIDTLGPRGGDIHSPREFLYLDSLAERARLAALLLMKLASGDIAAPPIR